MNHELIVRIVLQKPPGGVDFGLQKGSGHAYEPVQVQQAHAQDIRFECPVTVKGDRQTDEKPGFSGPFVQGSPPEKFIYIDIGTYAGQRESIWGGRLKVPLRGISWDTIEEVIISSELVLETQVPGSAKDGSPACATVKPFGGWHINKA
ncbi:DUF5990 family protein [Spirosoma endbachense]|uniref:Uncharacterized protein n=1 Tax=Spirosoma endbachense TaxID=2666025 RepID=A0A6P1VVD0_9BACT|nr:DUF5990 family protein [Spirosoma endbachense]QHV96695.1 hypothetical protein GJR95_17510 [Spirosoma endbachense]